MIEKLVKNRTPYLGKMVLKFERHPYYTSGKDGKLNKVHLNLWFTKLVTRFKPKQVMEGYSNIDPKKVELIEKYTGGVIGTHKWDNDEFVLEDSFLTKDGKYIGNIETAWWYFQNGMTVCEEYPNGVAIVWNTVNSDKTLMKNIIQLLRIMMRRNLQSGGKHISSHIKRVMILIKNTFIMMESNR
jgi:hypothetical protein